MKASSLTQGAQRSGRPRVVTLGGGHGQASLLRALGQLSVELSAIVSVSDDGGCSGQLRKQSGMPPPGDLRRCLTALATRGELASMYEERLPIPGDRIACAGNLVLQDAYRRFGSMQAAADWAAEALVCRGRVIPVSETPGIMQVCDSDGRILSGESLIEANANAPIVAAVHGGAEANPVAVQAIEDAEFIFFAPGSFFTSTLAAIATPGIAGACLASEARVFLVANLAAEERQTEGWPNEKYARILRDHLTIGSLGEEPTFDLIVHDEREATSFVLDDGTRVWRARLARERQRGHDPHLVADALRHWFGFELAAPDGLKRDGATDSESAAKNAFGAALALAMGSQESQANSLDESMQK